MWFFGRKVPRRRLGVRRAMPAGRSRFQRFRQAGGIGSVIIAAALLAVIVALDACPLEPLAHRQGGYLEDDVYARAAFEVLSPEKTRQQQDLAARSAPAVIALGAKVFQQIVADLKNLPGRLKAATQPAGLDKRLAERFALKGPKDLAAFAGFAAPEAADEYNRQVDRLGQRLLGRFLVTAEDFSQAHHARLSQEVRVVGAGEPPVRGKHLLLSLTDTDGLGRHLEEAAGAMDPAVRPNVLHYLAGTLANTPLFSLDRRATDAAEAAARAAVPPVAEQFPAGSPVARRTTHQGLSAAEVALLRAEHDAFLQQRDRNQPWERYRIFLGRAAVLLAVVLLLALYAAKYRPALAANHWQGLAVAALLALMLGLSKLAVHVMEWNPLLTVFGIFTAGVILTIAYDQRLAFALAGALVVLTVLQLRGSLTELMVLWTAAAAGIFQLREVRTRSKLIETGAITAAAVLVLVFATQSARGAPLRFTLVDAGWAAVAALAGGFISQGILPLVERIFGIATSLTLLEWCDAERPLLKRLALEARGTYNHSLTLGTLCEAAAQPIGANGLLARVGAYYHDVGKMNKPDYFVENQPSSASKHDRLSPTMSLLLIRGHVKDGLELAKEYGLPPVLHEFITSHHGTTLVEYFYHAAAQQRNGETDRAPDEVEFRYPGPKPRSKEAAILMLADAAESSTRAMSDYSPGKIENQVHAVVHKRLMDGQLDDCGLTLQEVHQIEHSLVESLCGIYHARLPYPSQQAPAGNQDSPAPPNQPAALGARPADPPA